MVRSLFDTAPAQSQLIVALDTGYCFEENGEVSRSQAVAALRAAADAVERGEVAGNLPLAAGAVPGFFMWGESVGFLDESNFGNSCIPEGVPAASPQAPP